MKNNYPNIRAYQCCWQFAGSFSRILFFFYLGKKNSIVSWFVSILVCLGVYGLVQAADLSNQATKKRVASVELNNSTREKKSKPVQEGYEAEARPGKHVAEYTPELFFFDESEPSQATMQAAAVYFTLKQLEKDDLLDWSIFSQRHKPIRWPSSVGSLHTKGKKRSSMERKEGQRVTISS